jgi:hypothetical protein
MNVGREQTLWLLRGRSRGDQANYARQLQRSGERGGVHGPSQRSQRTGVVTQPCRTRKVARAGVASGVIPAARIELRDPEQRFNARIAFLHYALEESKPFQERNLLADPPLCRVK